MYSVNTNESKKGIIAHLPLLKNTVLTTTAVSNPYFLWMYYFSSYWSHLKRHALFNPRITSFNNETRPKPPRCSVSITCYISIQMGWISKLQKFPCCSIDETLTSVSLSWVPLGTGKLSRSVNTCERESLSFNAGIAARPRWFPLGPKSRLPANRADTLPRE